MRNLSTKQTADPRWIAKQAAKLASPDEAHRKWTKNGG